MSDVTHKIITRPSLRNPQRNVMEITEPTSRFALRTMLSLAMPVMGFVPTIVPRSAPVRMQVGRTRA
jgi:hypothetical protein